MFRRLTSLLIVWFGLLAVIAPVVTCEAAVQRADCCPPEGPAPCGECADKRPPPGPSETRCVVAPVQVIAVAAATPTSAAHNIDSDAPDPLAAIELPPMDGRQRVEKSHQPQSAARVAGSAAPIYLVTGRLRL